MAENVKSLLYILVLSLPTFYIAQRIAVPLISDSEFRLWRNSWLCCTAAAFLSGNFFVFIAALIVICLYVRSRGNRIGLFIVLLFATPLVQVDIGGFGIVNQLIALDHAQILTIFLLLPVLMSLPKARRSVSHGSDGPPLPRAKIGKICDYAVVAYILVQTALTFRDSSVTAVLRVAVVYTLTIGIPYFAVSRAVQGIEEARTVLVAFVVAALPLAVVGIFEVSKSWLLYPSMPMSWGVQLLTPYVERDGMLRATASTAQPIALGYTLMVALGCLLAIRVRLPDKRGAWLTFCLLIGGLASSLSRGPWLGAVIMILVLVMTSPHRLKNIGKLLFVGICMSPFLLTPSGDRVLRLLPFVGSVEPGSVEYRNRLIDNAIAVIQHSPLTGVPDYTQTAEMQEMLQGQGIIDVTNTYLQIALQFGLLGLGVFVVFFATVVTRLGLSLKAISPSALSLPALFATLIAILFTIVTVSSISFIPYIYWIFAGLIIGLLRSTAQKATPVGAGEETSQYCSENAGPPMSALPSAMEPARYRL